MGKNCYTYIITNKYHSVLYTGVTSDIHRRMFEHKNGSVPGFASQYSVNKLVYLEFFYYIQDAIAREKKIKGMSRRKKEDLIAIENPNWRELKI
jgi:putative endonuclease